MEKVGAYTDRATENGEWRAGNPGLGQQATPMLAAYFNMLQRELVGVVEGSGLVLDQVDNTQMLQAIRRLAVGQITALSSNTVLTAQQMGLVLVDAALGNRQITLPAANAALGVVDIIVRRTDATANALVIAASGTDKLMLDTTAAAAGQASTELLFAGDHLRLRSDGAGKWWCIGQAQLPGSIDSGLVVYNAPGVHNFTVPAVLRSGRRRAKVTVIGGGGPGGSASASANFNAGAGGGGAGGAAIKLINLSGVSSVPVTVAAGGVAGANGSTVGTNGGTSSFGAYCSATGGISGNPISGGVSIAGTSAGNPGGTATGGDINVPGGGGCHGVAQYPTVAGSSVGGGAGGVSVLSGAQFLGAGGQGAATTANAAVGQNGAPGAALIEW